MGFAFGTGEISSILCALLWGVAVVLFRASGARIPPVALNLFKDVIALILFSLTMLVLQVPFLPPANTWGDWGWLALSGAIGIGVSDTLFFASLNRIGAGRMAVVDCAYAPLVSVFSVFALGERMGPWLLAGMGLMLVAVLLAGFEPKGGEPVDRRTLVQGVGLGLLAMALSAIGIVMVKPILDRSDPWWATTVRLIAGAVLVAGTAMWKSNRAAVARTFRPGRHWRVAIPSAVTGTYLAMFLWILGVKHTRASVASVLNQLSTLFIVVLAVVFLKEKLTLRKSLAVILAIAGALMAPN